MCIMGFFCFSTIPNGNAITIQKNTITHRFCIPCNFVMYNHSSILPLTNYNVQKLNN
jgi:hypothetical protein